MLAMPEVPSTPFRRRLTFKRVLLALVLGLSSWWGVSWWLSPRPLYTLHLGRDPDHPGRRGYLSVSFLDPAHTFLRVTHELPRTDPTKESVRLVIDVVELATGRTIASFPYQQTYEFPEGTLYSLAAFDGT